MTNPVMVVKSKTAKKVYVSGDPNWDDQVLILNGSTDESYALVQEGHPVTASVDWGSNPPDALMMGVLISEQKNGDQSAYQLTIGVNPDTGKMDVTEPYSYGDPGFEYSITDRTETTVTLLLKDP